MAIFQSECLLIESSQNISITNSSFVDLFIHNGNTVAIVFNKKFENIEHSKIVDLSLLSLRNISSPQGSVISVSSSYRSSELCLALLNDSLSNSSTTKEKGKQVKLCLFHPIIIESCEFFGEVLNDERIMEVEDVCEWNGSLVDLSNCSAKMMDTIISGSHHGGLSIDNANVTIEKGVFANNTAQNIKYPSARRNIICDGSGELKITGLKGGDGLQNNTSLWIRNRDCKLYERAGERASPFFIPTLNFVEYGNKEESDALILKGTLFLPCNLSLGISVLIRNREEVETHLLESKNLISEEEINFSTVSPSIISSSEEAEVSVFILFGDADSPSATDSFILKNRSESKTTGDERIAEGGKKERSIWSIIVIVLVVILLIVLIISIIVTIRWRKAKNEAEDLREIVNDNIRKDPKAFEMVTMEMSPEEQWRRAEREAEKKNEERIKKRVYGKEMQHSESEEYLLSENGSTEYILGRDSDKIPQWMLEKIDEKEIEDETRKRTPSPSISSTSTTDTSDSDSTFVRGEDLCPTTSSMSNLVDAMACSSPHEKLIVDLRDSLFMLLHGRNGKKEMAIGSLQQREQTAAQILFWVANLALHSFDGMENPLQSLANLSPHIVLFSEHMVICIVMHSDFSSDDSDSSSSSSSTIAISTSDDDEEESLPSSAFEDEDDFKKECLRWKAPELLIDKKMGATKESVSFSIGMMLWECLTLKIPFGDYEAEVAGQKIVNGERPKIGIIEQSHLSLVVRSCWCDKGSERMTLNALKREFIQCFPAGAVILTMTDAIALEESGRFNGNESELESGETLL
ncbi:uncharacterized protein MONOS_5245 [Monocercomonoides exilis]|uniref:uncharacterized protein n=1 Tax=Monocercomonoides exilis TaxID=2049356 RepID=UPI00355A9879|nr:hypothetical protein MONOS_5245 [Monocercomonoides exilis]|eukprot:MONOS_5245.1-p1 / transcript=MONOS_5245.1 / gene=MONOS_5245 / organism=Monocercomonoides_exilis_PA203 / gene_product=unspecified product / transcript_product=unspecified product / location=Mono_scaffold00150:55737-58151(-) / protein_length=804 / sequence_SO=supercontig / SO=protein_coding / is_pseudo=false